MLEVLQRFREMYPGTGNIITVDEAETGMVVRIEHRATSVSFNTGVPRKSGLFAELIFHRNSLGMEVVTHEFTHAAFCWAERRGLDLSKILGKHNWKVHKRGKAMARDGVEERFCYALGQMANQFTKKCCDIGLYS